MNMGVIMRTATQLWVTRGDTERQDKVENRNSINQDRSERQSYFFPVINMGL